MNKLFLSLVSCSLIFSFIFISACTKVRESAGVNRRVIDEYTVFQNPPLALPPDYNLLPSEEIIARKKNVNTDEELSKEILFGLNEETTTINSNVTSSALDSILEKSGSNEVSNDIRKDFDTDLAEITSTKGVFGGEKYMNEDEILDAAAESERIRDNIFNNKDILEGDIPITTKPKDRRSLLKRLFLRVIVPAQKQKPWQ